MDIFKLEKAKLFEDLAEKLTTECNKKTYHGDNGNEEIIGWAREAGIPTSSTLNTGEVLLGLLSARNVIIHGKLSKAVSDCINGGIQSLIHNQCKTGGWTTSESDSSWASGNMVSTAIAIWAFSEFELMYNRDSKKINSVLSKAYIYLVDSQTSPEFNYKFRHSSDKSKVMATAYAFLSYVNLTIYKNNVRDGNNLFIGIDNKIDNILDLLLESISNGKAKFFEQAICFIALKQIYKHDIYVVNKEKVSKLYSEIEDTLYNLDPKQAVAPYKDVRDVRENGTESEFCYFTACWLLIALDYCYSTETPYKKDLLRTIASTFTTSNNKLSICYEGREWIWAIAQVLMSLSIHSSTQRLDEFMKIDRNDNQNDIFLIYGRNVELKNSLTDILNALSLNVITYNNSNANTTGTYNAVKEGINKSAVSIVLLTGDDEGRCRKQYQIPADRNTTYETHYTNQPRLNVVFEAGYSYASRSDKNVILIAINNVRLFSDIDGLNRIIIQTDHKGHIIQNSIAKFKKELLDNLRNCGCNLPQNAESIINGIPLPDRII